MISHVTCDEFIAKDAEEIDVRGPQRASGTKQRKFAQLAACCGDIGAFPPSFPPLALQSPGPAPLRPRTVRRAGETYLETSLKQ